MKKTSLIAKYETRLAQSYSLYKACILKRDDINDTLKASQGDYAIKATYTMMARLNDDDITSHAYTISILEGIVGDLHLISDLN